eukprot:09730.XXX_314951_315175_1 [CDS] Oithona nana genome sequencing.
MSIPRVSCSGGILRLLDFSLSSVCNPGMDCSSQDWARTPAALLIDAASLSSISLGIPFSECCRICLCPNFPVFR